MKCFFLNTGCLASAACSIFYQKHSSIIPARITAVDIHAVQYGTSYHALIVSVVLIVLSVILQLLSWVYFNGKEVKTVKYELSISFNQ